ncbi:hypothetical protein [Sulfurovum sp.]|uniref:hypothetical protein n=1 Tax=Sulfurovum sp. TaxID=1969726 RepID=UPI00356183D0
MLKRNIKTNSVTLLACTDTLAPRIKLEKRTLEDAGFDIEVLYSKRDNSKRSIGKVGKYVWSLLENMIYLLKSNKKVVHFTNIDQLIISPVLKLFRKKIVYDAYERYSIDISQRYFNGTSRGIARKIIEFIENTYVRLFVDAVFVVSTPDEFLKKRYAKICKICDVLYNVPPLDSICTIDLEKKFKEKVFRIAYVGRCTSLIIESINEIAMRLDALGVIYEIHLVGGIFDEMLQSCDPSYYSERKLHKNICLHGHMEYQSMSKFLVKFHVGLTLLPNPKEYIYAGPGSSRKNFTYMCAGMAIISNSPSGPASVIINESCGIALDETDSIESFAVSINKIYKNRNEAMEYSSNGILAIKNKYNWDHEKEKFLYAYSKLTERVNENEISV